MPTLWHAVTESTYFLPYSIYVFFASARQTRLYCLVMNVCFHQNTRYVRRRSGLADESDSEVGVALQVVWLQSGKTFSLPFWCAFPKFSVITRINMKMRAYMQLMKRIPQHRWGSFNVCRMSPYFSCWRWVHRSPAACCTCPACVLCTVTLQHETACELVHVVVIL